MMVIARYPCLTYQSTLPSYFQSLLTPRSYSLITFFAQLSLSSYSYILLLYSKLRHLLLPVLTCSARPDDPRITFSRRVTSRHGSRHTDPTIVFSLNRRYSHLNPHPFLLLITIFLIRHAILISTLVPFGSTVRPRSVLILFLAVTVSKSLFS